LQTFYAKLMMINFEGIDEDLAAFQEDEMVQQALKRGVDLKKYGRELEKDLNHAELDSVRNYINLFEKYNYQYQEMQECDRVLARMEEMLHGFQADLGEISSEIKHLQEDSISMSIKLKNRRTVEEKLRIFLDKSSLPPFVLKNIMSSQVNDGFLNAVVILGKRLNYFELQQPAADGSSLDLLPSETGCGRSLVSEFEKLKVKAVAKSREYFLNQLNAIRKPKTNISIVQQNSLLKYAPLFHFLNREQPSVADEIRSSFYFASYYTSNTSTTFFL
jgi:vacuolar protein sorting-associated protein 52